MTNQEIQDFTLRVTQGNKTDLVVTTYDIILTYIAYAQKADKEENKEAFVWNVKKAKEFLQELMQSLDYRTGIGLELFRLYEVCSRTLIQCEMKRRDEKLSSVVKIINNLREAFFEVAKQDTSGPVMAGSTQVYAGLTYSKGTLNESCQPKGCFRA